MRLLFIFDIGFDRIGPSVHLLQDVLKSALKEGHDVSVILKNTNGPDSEMPEEFASHPKFHYTVIKESPNKAGFITRYLNDVKYAQKCGRIVRGHGSYDVVFLQSNVVAYFYMKWLARMDCKIVFNVQDIFPYNLKLSGQLPLEPIAFPFFRKLQNMAYKKADAIITISDDMKQTLIEDGIASDKITVIYNWSYADAPISLGVIEPENIFDLHLDPEKYNVIYAGNIGKMQNVEIIASTAIKMKDNNRVHFYIIGAGANKQHIEEMTEDLSNVSILPMQPAKYAESIYSQADLNVIPLAPGGIKTALPSKTATVLRINKPVVFCIDQNSCFSRMFEKDENIKCIDCNDYNELYSYLTSNCGKKKITSEHRIYDVFSVRNADKYVRLMEEICNKAE